MHRDMRPLLSRFELGEIDPTAVITHRLPLDDAPDAYSIFRDQRDGGVTAYLLTCRGMVLARSLDHPSRMEEEQ